VLPKVIGVLDYGYWQLYLFYLGYVGFLHFGWNDGVYLRYGGKLYNELNKDLFFSQFYMLFIFQVIIGILIFVFTFLIHDDINKVIIIRFISLSLILVNTRYFLLFTLQATNRFKEYSYIILLDKIFFITLLIGLLLFGIRKFQILIIADTAGKLISWVYAAYVCKDIVFRKFSNFSITINEVINNISVGINLMFAAIASKLIVGVVRFGIERKWNIVIFGKISLILSISNMLLLFFNTLGLVLFPLLRRSKKGNLANIYNFLRDILMVVLFATLFMYYPVIEILSNWLPKYKDSLIYMPLLFPISVYEGKMALLIMTYLKTLRKEKIILKVNIYFLVLSILSTFIIIVFFNKIEMLIISILFILAFRSIYAEILLSKILNIHLLIDILLEIGLTIIFVSSGWFLESWNAMFIYGCAYFTYLFIKRKNIGESVSQIKTLYHPIGN
jgi:O-antigen/teichoic acid export membrane protein